MSDEGFTTRALRARADVGPAVPITVPIYQTSVFAFDDAAELAETIRTGKDAGFVYTRWHNPTRAAFEEVVARLEGAERAVSFSSGMAAITSTLAALARSGDHVVSSPGLYGGSFSVMRKLLPRWGIEVTLAKSHRAEDMMAAIRPDTVCCYTETIGNPTVPVPDLDALGEGCRSAKVPLVVDGTFASPFLCTPIDFGASVVIHSTTKYLGGHHDLTGGVASGDADTIRAVREMAIDLGGTASAFESWLALRGTATLALRMQRHCENAQALAEFLEGHAKVSRVWYPGLPTHPDHDVARRVLRGFGGMLAFELRDGLEAGRRFVESVRVASMAASLGGTHTLVIHPATVTHTQLSAAEREEAGIADGLVRVSTGIEDTPDLVGDFARALDRA